VLEHLLTADAADYLPLPPEVVEEGFVSAQKLSAEQEVDSKFNTAMLLEELGVPPDSQVDAVVSADTARHAFAALTAGASDAEKKHAVARVETPEAVKQLVGMLTQYDWEFVEQAKSMRGYAVAQLIEETKHPDARIRLKALELLGKVTEVALFTERTEVKTVGMTDTELDEELKKRLDKYRALKEKEIEGEVVVPVEKQA
jgi:hypothetical protein